MRVAKLALLPLLFATCVVAQPRPAQALSRTFMCFYSSGEALPTARCQQQVQTIVDDWLRLGGPSTCADRPTLVPSAGRPPSRIEVEGHADSAEEARGIADRVARQRAEAIAALLRANCVPADKIVVLSKGASANLVPSDPGEDEPQNRRAPIFIR